MSRLGRREIEARVRDECLAELVAASIGTTGNAIDEGQVLVRLRLVAARGQSEAERGLQFLRGDFVLAVLVVLDALLAAPVRRRSTSRTGAGGGGRGLGFHRPPTWCPPASPSRLPVAARWSESFTAGDAQPAQTTASEQCCAPRPIAGRRLRSEVIGIGA